MKNYNLISAVLFITCFSSALGQTGDQKTVKRISISEFYLQTGLLYERVEQGSVSDFKKLANQSVLLNNNLANYNNFSGSILQANTFLSAMVGIKFRNKEKTDYRTNPVVRLGISYFSSSHLSGALGNSERNTYDSLTSGKTGETVYLDSVTRSFYRMYYASDQLRLDGSIIFRTNPEARWSLFTGIGFNVGFSINSNTEIYSTKFNDTEIRREVGSRTFSSFSSNYSENNGKSERFINKTNIAFSTFIPMGIDFRIGKTSEFWKRIHLFYEARPGINVTLIPELHTITNVSLQQGIGLKFSW